MRSCLLFLLGMSLAGSVTAAEYVVAHAPNNAQWKTDLYFRTAFPDTALYLEAYTATGGNGPGTSAWTSEVLVVEKANSVITPQQFGALIDGRAFDFLVVIADKALGEGKVNFSEANVAHSTRVFGMETYTASANFNNLTIDETLFAGIAFVVVNPEEQELRLRYRLSGADGTILAERLAPEGGAAITSRYYKVLALAEALFPDVAIPANARINVAVNGTGKVVGGILLQGSPKTMYGGEAESVDADITFAKQVSRIFRNHCQSCHHSEGSAPFSLMGYDEAFPQITKIQNEVVAGRMPPWKPSPGCMPFKYANILDDRDRETLLAWIRDGAPEGDPADLPEPLVFESGDWQMGLPDREVFYSEPVRFEPGPDQYLCLPIELQNPEPVELRGLELLPGNLKVVHHIVLYAATGTEARSLDERSVAPGFLCFGSAGIDEAAIIGAWAPGALQEFFPLDVGMTLPPNTTLIMQMHYSAELGITEPETDQSRIGLFYANEPRPKELQFHIMYANDFVVPAGEADYILSDHEQFDQPLELYMVFPHMHLLGKSISLEVSFPDGGSQCLVDITDWDFDWQGFYHYPEPVHIPAFSVFTNTGIYDNSTGNPNNPNNPPKDVYEGEGTGDEMLVTVLGFATLNPKAKRR